MNETNMFSSWIAHRITAGLNRQQIINELAEETDTARIKHARLTAWEKGKEKPGNARVLNHILYYAIEYAQPRAKDETKLKLFELLKYPEKDDDK